MSILFFDADHAFGARLRGIHLRKRTAHGMLARPMRQENQLDKARFIPLP